jgi:hypothetical protein
VDAVWMSRHPAAASRCASASRSSTTHATWPTPVEGDAVRGGQAGVDRVHLGELQHDRPPGGEGGAVVEVGRIGDPGAVGEPERVEAHVAVHQERADAEGARGGLAAAARSGTQ